MMNDNQVDQQWQWDHLQILENIDIRISHILNHIHIRITFAWESHSHKLDHIESSILYFIISVTTLFWISIITSTTTSMMIMMMLLVITGFFSFSSSKSPNSRFEPTRSSITDLGLISMDLLQMVGVLVIEIVMEENVRESIFSFHFILACNTTE